MTPLYQIKDLDFRYALGSQWISALNQVSCEIESGKITCLTGPSGSGKSTLLNVLGLIEPIQKGDVHFLGRSLRGLTEAEKNNVRRFEIGFIFQSFQLFPVLDAEENVAYFLVKQGVPEKELRARVEAALRAVDLWEHRKKRPLEMSGGQRQRVAIARAIAKHPKVIIADEPTASLDQKTGRTIMQILRDLKQKQGVSIVVSSHDPMVLEFADNRIQLRDGALV